MTLLARCRKYIQDRLALGFEVQSTAAIPEANVVGDVVVSAGITAGRLVLRL